MQRFALDRRAGSVNDHLGQGEEGFHLEFVATREGGTEFSVLPVTVDPACGEAVGLFAADSTGQFCRFFSVVGAGVREVGVLWRLSVSKIATKGCALGVGRGGVLEFGILRAGIAVNSEAVVRCPEQAGHIVRILIRINAGAGKLRAFNCSRDNDISPGRIQVRVHLIARHQSHTRNKQHPGDVI